MFNSRPGQVCFHYANCYAVCLLPSGSHGLPQGIFVKRHQVFKEDGRLLSPSDFAVGETVTIYGRTYMLVDCDTYTRDWFQQNLGAEQGTPLGYPNDPVDEYRETFGLTSRPGMDKCCCYLLQVQWTVVAWYG